jgi:hypothetical protein
MMYDDTWTEDPDFDSMFKILHNEYVAMKRLLFETGIVSGQKDARIAALEAENAALRPLAEAVEILSKNQNRCVICANREPGHWHAYTGRPEAHESTLAAALIALAGELE